MPAPAGNKSRALKEKVQPSGPLRGLQFVPKKPKKRVVKGY